MSHVYCTVRQRVMSAPPSWLRPLGWLGITITISPLLLYHITITCPCQSRVPANHMSSHPTLPSPLHPTSLRAPHRQVVAAPTYRFPRAGTPTYRSLTYRSPTHGSLTTGAVRAPHRQVGAAPRTGSPTVRTSVPMHGSSCTSPPQRVPSDPRRQVGAAPAPVREAATTQAARKVPAGLG